MEQANAAYQQTADHLDTAVRAANPGMDHPPAMSFEQIVHSIYMTAILQLGGATKPGEQPKIDLMGARQSIDMLAILAEKTKGNLTPAESQLMDNALFEIRMGFLEVTQALARSAANRQPPPSGAARPPHHRPLETNASNPHLSRQRHLDGSPHAGMRLRRLPLRGLARARPVPAPSPRNRRTRPSVLISWEGHNVVIDTGPDFHAQAIAAGIHRLDAVLYTHGHADHVLGMDDLRPLSFHSPSNLPLYADEQTALTIERIFNYTFGSEHSYPTSARVALHRIPATPGAEVVTLRRAFPARPRHPRPPDHLRLPLRLRRLSHRPQRPSPGERSPARRPRPPHPRRSAP